MSRGFCRSAFAAVEEGALFCPAQSKSPKARDILLAAQRIVGLDLQLEALRYIGMFGGTQNLQCCRAVCVLEERQMRRRILRPT
jgi:hypothetical protein